MDRAPLAERAIIRIDGKDAELVLNGRLSWACADAKTESALNEHLRSVKDYYPDPVRFYTESAAATFGAEIISIPGPLEMREDPFTIY